GRESPTILGASGINHPAQAIGVDDKHDRVIVVAAEPDPRIAALMQGDIQAIMPRSRVVVARPLAFDIGSFSRSFIQQFGKVEFSAKAFGQLVQSFKADDGTYPGLDKVVAEIIGPTLLAFNKVKLPSLDQFFDIVRQAAIIDWGHVI